MSLELLMPSVLYTDLQHSLKKLVIPIVTNSVLSYFRPDLFSLG